MNEKKTYICITCPKGCKITIEKNKDNYVILGNECPRGKEYVLTEHTTPTRVITTTITVTDGVYPVTSVKTTVGVPKEKIFDVLNIINNIDIQSPCTVGDIILKNISNTGADLVVTRNC